MTTIGVIGASGQVGTEVCLFLKTYPTVRSVAIVRTGISGALLQRLGVEVRVGTLEDPYRCTDLLRDCDLVADFSVKSGEVADIKAHYHQNITRALECMRADARYVFISTINAFGASPRFNRAKHYFLPHSIYAYTKRYAERLAMRLGERLGRETYVFRLGHVHGLLQRVSEETRQLVRGPYRRFEYPDTPSYTVFCHTIAEGLIHVAQGSERPAIYTVISEPPWTWREILSYYAERDSQFEVELRQSADRAGPLRRATAALQSRAMQFLNEYRETLRANVLHFAPSLERRAAAFLYVRRARQQIQEFQRLSVYRPPDLHQGVFPGPRLTRISDCRFSMHTKTDQVREMLSQLVAGNGGSRDREVRAGLRSQ
jgi:nucleoside-diphosphate-sugar epimerase